MVKCAEKQLRSVVIYKLHWRLARKPRSSQHDTREQMNVFQTGVIHWVFLGSSRIDWDDFGIRSLFHEIVLATFKMWEMMYYFCIEANSDLLGRV